MTTVTFEKGNLFVILYRTDLTTGKPQEIAKYGPFWTVEGTEAFMSSLITKLAVSGVCYTHEIKIQVVERTE